MARTRVVVIGAGIAGARVVAALCARAASDRIKIDVIDAEVYGTYDRFELPRLLAGTARLTDIVRFDVGWFESRGVTLHADTRVHLIDRFRRRVQANGLQLGYDKLVLATGSTPYLPSIRQLLLPSGGLHPGVSTFHTIDDCLGLTALIGRVRRVVVLGGGRQAFELAEALAQRGVDVHLFCPSLRALSGELLEVTAAVLRARVEAAAVNLHFGQRATGVSGELGALELELHDGSSFACDALVLATGHQPETWLAYQCGLTVERAVVVEGRLRSVDDLTVHALGECAEWRGRIHASPEQIIEQAEVIAEHLTSLHSERRYVGLAPREV